MLLFKKKYAIGIDFGTTNCCISTMVNGKPIIIENENGKRTTESAVYIPSNSSEPILIGENARRKGFLDPSRIFLVFKRLLCKKYDEISDKIRKSYTVKIINDNGYAAFEILIDGKPKVITVIEVYTHLFRKLKQQAENYLQAEISSAVVTIPAYFDNNQREATKQAAELAGLKVERIINEPTAAAVAYGLDKSGFSGNLAVYDLGGGTFDVSILEMSSNEQMFAVRSTKGDAFLGGDDADRIIVDILIKKFSKENNIILDNLSGEAKYRLYDTAIKAKHELSSSLSTEASLPYFIQDKSGKPLHLNVKITRGEYETAISSLINSTINIFNNALSDADLSSKDIKAIIKVGGMTRTPLITDLIKKTYNLIPRSDINPDEAVAVGASIMASVDEDESGENNIILLDVLSLSVGIKVDSDTFESIIDRNTSIPITNTKTFTTAMDNQPEVEIEVYQGERRKASMNKKIGNFTLKGIQRAPRGVPQIEVSINIDTNGIINVSAKDKQTGVSHQIEITSDTSINKEEAERIAKEAEKYKEIDEAEIKIAQKQNDIQYNYNKLKSLEIPEEFNDRVKIIDENYANYLNEKDDKVLDDKNKEIQDLISEITAHNNKNKENKTEQK